MCIFDELVHFVAINRDPDHVHIAMLTTARLVGAFDASGKKDRSSLVVAGFISSAKDWQSFDQKWTDRLKADGLEYFHMVDFAGSREQFSCGWKNNEERRRSLLADLVGIIQSTAYRSFVSIVENKHFDILSPANQKDFALNAYSLAGRGCVAKISEWRKRESGFGDIATGYVFEEGDEGSGALVNCMLCDKYPAPIFGPKKDRPDKDGNTVVAYTPLQAADILAYEVSRLFEDTLSPYPRFTNPSNYRWAMKEFMKAPGMDWGYYSPKNMDELNEKLTTLIRDANPLSLV